MCFSVVKIVAMAGKKRKKKRTNLIGVIWTIIEYANDERSAD